MFSFDSSKSVKLSFVVSSVEHRTIFVHLKKFHVAKYLKSTHRLIEVKRLTIEIYLDFHLLLPRFRMKQWNCQPSLFAICKQFKCEKKIGNVQCGLCMQYAINRFVQSHLVWFEGWSIATFRWIESGINIYREKFSIFIILSLGK